MRVVSFAVRMSVVAVSVIASAVWHSPVERIQGMRQAALTNPRAFAELISGSMIASSSTMIFALDHMTCCRGLMVA
jgi:hypothetical protein